jgi:hypothetical protein
MQADIQGDLAGYFAANLYEQCALGKSLADAIFEARKKLAADKLLSNEYIDWALPSMVSIAEGLTVFNPQSAPATPQFQQCREFRDARFFADCREPRRKCTNWIYPADGSCSSQNVLLITGERKSGKSHLLKWCMETWALGGARVRYIELHGQSKSLLDILRQIRKGEPYGTLEDEYLHHPLPPEAFKRFTWELTTLLRTGELGEWIEADHLSGPEDVQDDDGLLTATSDKRLEPIVCTRFWAALKAAAGGRPLILVFDRLGGPNGERTLSPPDFKQLVLNLLVPIAQEANSSIKLAFSASSAEAKDYSLEFLPEQNSVSYQLPIDFTDDQLAELAAEAVWFRKADKVKQAAKALFGFGGNDAKGLGRLKSVFDAIGQDPEFAGVRMR